MRDLLRSRHATRLGLLAATIVLEFGAAELVERVEEFNGGGMQVGKEQARRLRKLPNHPKAEGRPPLNPEPSSGSSNSNCVID